MTNLTSNNQAFEIVINSDATASDTIAELIFDITIDTDLYKTDTPKFKVLYNVTLDTLADSDSDLYYSIEESLTMCGDYISLDKLEDNELDFEDCVEIRFSEGKLIDDDSEVDVTGFDLDDVVEALNIMMTHEIPIYGFLNYINKGLGDFIYFSLESFNEEFVTLSESDRTAIDYLVDEYNLDESYRLDEDGNTDLWGDYFTIHTGSGVALFRSC